VFIIVNPVCDWLYSSKGQVVVGNVSVSGDPKTEYFAIPSHNITPYEITLPAIAPFDKL